MDRTRRRPKFQLNDVLWIIREVNRISITRQSAFRPLLTDSSQYVIMQEGASDKTYALGADALVWYARWPIAHVEC